MKTPYLPLVLLIAATTSAVPMNTHTSPTNTDALTRNTDPLPSNPNSVNPDASFLVEIALHALETGFSITKPSSLSSKQSLASTAAYIHERIREKQKEASRIQESETDAILMLEKGVEALDLPPNTPTTVAHAKLLTLAIFTLDVPTIRRLLEYGSLGEVALTEAINAVAAWGDVELTKLILADPRLTNFDGEKALTNACKANQRTVASILLDDPRIRLHTMALIHAIKNYNTDIVQKFFRLGADLIYLTDVIQELKDAKKDPGLTSSHFEFLKQAVTESRRSPRFFSFDHFRKYFFLFDLLRKFL